MKNIITLEGDVPNYKGAYIIGVINGLGIPYKINKKSPLYRTLGEYRRGEYLKIQEQVREKLDEGVPNFILISGEGKDDTKVTRVYSNEA